MLEATVGVTGVAFTTTLVVPAADVHPFSVSVTLYIPPSASAEEATVGFCADAVNPFGPVHVYVPVVAEEERLIGFPVHTGELEETEGAAGVAFTTTFVVPADEVHPLSVMVTLNVPASASVAGVTVGFCTMEANPFGPLQL